MKWSQHIRRSLTILTFSSFLWITIYCDCDDRETEAKIIFNWSEIESDAPIPNQLLLEFFALPTIMIRNTNTPSDLFKGDIPVTTTAIRAIGAESSEVIYKGLTSLVNAQARVPVSEINGMSFIPESGWLYAGKNLNINILEESVETYVITMIQCSHLIRIFIKPNKLDRLQSLEGILSGLSQGIDLTSFSTLPDYANYKFNFALKDTILYASFTSFGVGSPPDGYHLLLNVSYINGEKEQLSINLPELIGSNKHKTIPLDIYLQLILKEPGEINGSILPWKEGETLPPIPIRSS